MAPLYSTSSSHAAKGRRRSSPSIIQEGADNCGGSGTGPCIVIDILHLLIYFVGIDHLKAKNKFDYPIFSSPPVCQCILSHSTILLHHCKTPYYIIDGSFILHFKLSTCWRGKILLTIYHSRSWQWWFRYRTMLHHHDILLLLLLWWKITECVESCCWCSLYKIQ